MHRELDKFYTKTLVAERCINIAQPFLKKYNTIIEPSAGSGSFLLALEQHGLIPKTLSYDLLPESDYFNIKTLDWFDVKIEKELGSVAVVGNPPFGKRNILSKAFIQHAIAFENVSCIAMILPNAWEKNTLQKTFSRDWALVFSQRLEPDSFILENKEYKVPCVWQIWIKDWKGDDLRWEENPPTFCEDFSITLNPDEADFYLMGASPTTLKEIHEVKVNNRGYYIKSNIPVEDLRNNILSIPWNNLGSSTASGGVYWISKPELIKHYTSYFK
jgi:hypothetical protein